MKVKINDKNYHIGWQYSDKDAKNIPLSTTCFIRNENKEVVSEETVKRFYKDAFDKEIARKESLKKAINAIIPDDDVRAIVWKAYFERNERFKLVDKHQITRLKSLLHQCKKAFNEIENSKLENNFFTSTYDIAASIGKELKND